MKLPQDLNTIASHTWFKVVGGGAVVGAGGIGITQGLGMDPVASGLRVSGVDVGSGEQDDRCREVALDVEGGTMQVPVNSALLENLDSADDCDDVTRDDGLAADDGTRTGVDSTNNTGTDGGNATGSSGNSPDSSPGTTAPPSVAPQGDSSPDSTNNSPAPAPVAPVAPGPSDSADTTSNSVDSAPVAPVAPAAPVAPPVYYAGDDSGQSYASASSPDSSNNS